MNKLLVYPVRFGRPDMLIQPFFQGQVISQAAQQGHGGVCVGIYKARNQQVFCQFEFCICLVTDARLLCRQDFQDATFADCQAVVFIYRGFRFNRGDPATMDECVNGLHAITSLILFGCKYSGSTSRQTFLVLL